ncbi:hypothetical protein ACFLZZ_00210 [Nanoarchaeota archaeon]
MMLGQDKYMEDEEESLENLSFPERVFPRKKKTERDTLNSRIVVVSPYGQLNTYLSSEIPKIVPGGDVDVIDEAKSHAKPYIDIRKKESIAQKPLWIIDFGKIMIYDPTLTQRISGNLKNGSSVGVKKVAFFGDYRSWARTNDITCLIPRPDFSLYLERKITYDDYGNFESFKVPIKGYTKGISSDLVNLSKDRTNNLELFTKL